MSEHVLWCGSVTPFGFEVFMKRGGGPAGTLYLNFYLG